MAAEIPGRFKTFKPEETRLAQDFIRAGLIRGEVRAGVPLESERSRAIVSMDPRAGYWSRYPWMYKIDLVIENEAEVWIVGLDLKPRMASLTQLLLYKSLYQDQFRPTKPIRLAEVSRRDAPETRRILEDQGVAVFILPEA